MTNTNAPTVSFRALDDVGKAAPGRHVLGAVHFTTRCAEPVIHDGHLSVGIRMTESPTDGFAEVWSTDRPVRTGRLESISYAQDGEFLFGAAHIPETADRADATEAMYSDAVDLVDALGYRRIFRIWHYIGDVNKRDANGLEVYQAFCVGRARALERHEIAGDMPAATVIGARGGGIVCYFLACRSGVRVNIDNPRQVPPCHYPVRYGPRPPNFARATYLASHDGDERIYVSGTAGILGHQTTHIGDVEGQCRLALENIAHVIGAGNLSACDISPGSTLHDLRGIKVYVRHQDDIGRVREICREAFSRSADVVFLHADICRSDLLVEIEGIVERERPTTGLTPLAAPARPMTRRRATAAASEWESLPAAQQPDWREHPAYERVHDKLAAAPPLVSPTEIRELRAELAAVATGAAHVLQMGDCAESFYESTPQHTMLKIAALDQLAERFSARVGRKVVKIGRLAGQYAKPRSSPVEVADGVELPAFRGHLVNAEAPAAAARRHDPSRMLWAYQFSDDVQRALRIHRSTAAAAYSGPWSSHDALVLDYIGALVRVDESTGDRFLASTHFPWVGERTSGVGEAHVKLLGLVSNPVAAKIGPRATPQSVLALCEALDPRREPGRLSLIVRMGRAAIGGALPAVVRAVRDAGHPVVWLSDPMHGNTVRLPSGTKTRYLDDMVAEAAEFRAVLEDHRQHPGGLHLETAAYDVVECLDRPGSEADVPAGGYASLCDPRLNLDQAAALIDLVFSSDSSPRTGETVPRMW